MGLKRGAGGKLLRKGGKLTKCCCSICCAEAGLPATLYLPADNYEIDLPAVEGVPGACFPFCDVDLMSDYNITSIPSNSHIGGLYGWHYGVGVPGYPSIDRPGVFETAVACLSMNADLFCTKGVPPFP